MKTLKSLIITATILINVSSCQKVPQNINWDNYQGSKSSNQYAAIDEITPSNVAQLTELWSYASGDLDGKNRTQIQCNPLVIDGVLYGTNPTLKLFALNAANGEELWKFDPFDNNFKMFGMGVNRGLAFWSKGDDHRIMYAAGSNLYAVNAKSGLLVESFGTSGIVDLKAGYEKEDLNRFFLAANTPGIVFKNLYIIGTRVSESTSALPGQVRAYNILSGNLEWTFNGIPKQGELGADTWPTASLKNMGGANNWSGLSLDESREMLFIPTGSAAFDFYGGDRKGDNLFANSLMAVNANTGERIWHQQLVHHDLWDRDLPAPPNLITVERNGKRIDAVAQITKNAFVFVFDRETGEPLFEINEIPAPPSSIEGEHAAPTQPIPAAPPPFARNEIKESDISDRTKEIFEITKAKWEVLRKGHPYEPPSKEGTLVFPGFDGGGEWGGAAVDPDGIMYINASEMPWVLQMISTQMKSDGLLASEGQTLYQNYCMMCHGENLKGSGMFIVPDLNDVLKRFTKEEITATIRKGRGQMPAFRYLKQEKIEAILAFLSGSKEKVEQKSESNFPYPYVNTGYIKLVDPDGYPAIKPPWGTLNAIDLNTGEIKWKSTLGDHPELRDWSPEPTGAENYGGPVVTSGGLIFIAATKDNKFRVFNKETGELLKELELPASGFSTPATYTVNGKQYVVVACGGGKIGMPSGDRYVAFGLGTK